MTVTTSIHNAVRLNAHATGTTAAPLVVAAFDADNKRVAEVVFYVEDHALAAALAAAINKAVAAHRTRMAAE